MVAALRHPDWYMIAGHCFRRRAGVRVSGQRLRGEDFIVLWDALGGQTLQLSARAAALWRRFDGRTPVDDLWRAFAHDPATAPSQREVMDWVLQLVSAGLILSDHRLDPVLFGDKVGRKRDQMLELRASNPLAIRVPVLDPDRFLRWSYPAVKWLFTPLGAALIAAVILSGILAAALNWSALIGSADNQLLSQSGVLLLFLSYPVMKAVHEMGHGWVTRHFGGEVREAGLMFLLFVPVPYVDASSVTALPSKYQRMLVGAAGIIAEMTIASVALLIWLQIEPGVERAVLYSFIVMGSVSTLLFNGNPLLRFDAYYVLSDWLEIPNLAQRGSRILGDLVLTRWLGLRPQTMTPAPEAWAAGIYAVLSLLYRLSLISVIVLAISKLFYVLGIVLAFWAVIGTVLWPLARLSWRGGRMALMQNRGKRVLARLGVSVVLVIGLAGFVPLPFAAGGAGQIVPAPGSGLRAGAAGEIVPGAIADGSPVTGGQLLARLANPGQDARLAKGTIQIADLRERLQRGGLSVGERHDLEAALTHMEAELAEARARAAAREIRAPFDGLVSWRGGLPPVPGVYLARGDVLGHVIAASGIAVELAFPAAYAGRMPATGAQVEMLLPDGRRVTRPIARFQVLDTGSEVPEALRVPNGGTVPVQSADRSRALAPVMIAWVAPEGDLGTALGMRVEARIELAPEPLFAQALFHLRRLFLRVSRV